MPTAHRSALHRSWHHLGLLAALCSGCTTDRPPVQPAATIVDVVTVHAAGPGSSILEGVVRPRRDIALSFNGTGRLSSISVEIGDRVRKGQVLARLDTSEAAATTAEARAVLAAAVAEAAQAQDAARRAAGLDQAGALSAGEVGARDSAAAAAIARSGAARAALDRARSKAADDLIVAPESGIITGRLAEPGSVVAAGTGILNLAAGGVEIEVKLPETLQLGRFPVAEATFASQPGLRLRAPLRIVEPSASGALRLRTARFTLRENLPPVPLNTSAAIVLPGNASIPTVRVPLAAVSGMTGKAYVWVVDGTRVRRHAIDVTELRGDDALVLGLRDGQRIVSNGDAPLSDGQAVVTAGDDGRGR